MIIGEVKAEIVLNSRNEPTICFSVKTEKGTFKTSAPSGKSTGKYEAKQWNESVLHDVRVLNQIKFWEIKNVSEIETVSKTYSEFIGANSRFVLEASLLKALAREDGMELWELLIDEKSKKMRKIPMPVGNAIGGGLHSSKDRKIREGPEFQEFLFIPNTKKFSDAVKLNEEAYELAGEMLKKFDEHFKGERNDEGAWKTHLANEHVLKIMYIVAKKFNLRLGLDVASSSFYDGFYHYSHNKLNDLTQVKFIQRLIEEYELFYVEDPVDEREFYWFGKLLGEIDRSKTIIVGDDLTVTNYERLNKAIKKNSINAIIIKPNQNGSLFETKKVVDLAKKHGIKIILSHRSGETEDSTIADLAVAWEADFIKCGIYGPERRAKLKRLMEIERKIGKKH